MELFGEIVIEVIMIAAVVTAIACLAHLLRLSVKERRYLRRLRREQTPPMSAVVRRATRMRSRRNGHASQAAFIKYEQRAVLREKHS